MEVLELERYGNATMTLAQAFGSLQDVMGYVQERQQFGKPIDSRFSGRAIEAGGNAYAGRYRALIDLSRRL